ncbi:MULTISPECIES: SpoVG family protein [Crateriforma]|uniref:Putative septation protein SpoVG n=1 Tax=Crateriforma conspicua TaxID=2527996 RepID=A0A5C6FLS1_9PLAN|nr:MULTISPECIES: SpoVG family protein [Crateriforma]TWU63095.1 putative septation protein SpoVG [Crateriforma conspicua]
MNITEVRIKLMESSEDRLRAFCSITIDDCFVVRDLKIIDGTNGPFVAMPSRKLAGHCQRCGYKNHLRANFCNQCGGKLRLDADFNDSPQKLYADVAHPINSECRELIQNAVLAEFEAEVARASQPGYRSRYDDDFGFEDVSADDLDSEDRRNSGNRPAASAKSNVNEPAAKPKRSDDQRQEATLIDSAGEAGPPRPKMSDRPGDRAAAQARTTNSASVEDTESESDADDHDGFGAGIFDE